MAAETHNTEKGGFTIDGKLYEIPSLDSLNMDEAQVLYEYSGLTVEDFAGVAEILDDDDQIEDELDLDEQQRANIARLRNPGFLRALLHIAYARGNPHLGRRRVEKLIGEVNMLDAMVELAEAGADDEGGDADPPPSTTGPGESSPRNSVDSNESSGNPSNGDTAEPVDRPVLTTAGSSPVSASTPTQSDT